MEEFIKKQLEERNKRIIEAIIKKSELVCPNSIALIGIYGSFQSGDIYEKSDLDLCIVIHDELGWKVGACFILDDVAHDIYCTPWNRLESMAKYQDPYIANLLQLDIVYCPDDADRQRYLALREKVSEQLVAPFSLNDVNKAEQHVVDASKSYADVMLSETYGDCKYAVSGLLYKLEYAMYLYHKNYIRRGVKRIPEELASMDYLPKDFMVLYHALIHSETVDEMQVLATNLMKNVKQFAKEMKETVQIKSDLSEASLKGSYEEIYSNWRNKMYEAAKTNDAYLSCMTASSCQWLYDDMYQSYNMEKINLMPHIHSQNLLLAATSFDEALAQYKKNYDSVGLLVKYYQTIEEFEADYLSENKEEVIRI